MEHPEAVEPLALTLSVKEAALRLGVAPNTVYLAVCRGDIHAVRIGRRIVIPRASLERLLAPAA